MTLDIPAIARAALVTAWDKADTALRACTMYFRPTPSYDVATDITSVTWAATVSDKKVLQWHDNLTLKDAGLRTNQGAEERLRTCKIMVRAVDIGTEVPENDTEILINGVTWKIFMKDSPPADAFYILEGRT